MVCYLLGWHILYIPELESSQVQFAILWNGNQHAFTVLIQGNLNSLAYGHNLMRWDLNLITIRVSEYTVLMTWLSQIPEKKKMLWRTSRGWLTYPFKTQDLAQFVKNPGIIDWNNQGHFLRNIFSQTLPIRKTIEGRQNSSDSSSRNSYGPYHKVNGGRNECVEGHEQINVR